VAARSVGKCQRQVRVTGTVPMLLKSDSESPSRSFRASCWHNSGLHCPAQAHWPGKPPAPISRAEPFDPRHGRGVLVRCCQGASGRRAAAPTPCKPRSPARTRSYVPHVASRESPGNARSAYPDQQMAYLEWQGTLGRFVRPRGSESLSEPDQSERT
jgi:hypothetical protein